MLCAGPFISNYSGFYSCDLMKFMMFLWFSLPFSVANSPVSMFWMKVKYLYLDSPPGTTLLLTENKAILINFLSLHTYTNDLPSLYAPNLSHLEKSLTLFLTCC